MSRLYTHSLAVFAAAFLSLASITAIVTVPTAHALSLAPMAA